MRTIDLLARVRALTPTSSVYAVAQLLDLPEDTVRNWYRGISLPDALAQTKIAQVLDIPIEAVMATVELDREKKPERRAHWEQLARKFAACVVMGTAITTWPSDGYSAAGPERRSGTTTSPALDLLQIMRQLAIYLYTVTRRSFALAP